MLSESVSLHPTYRLPFAEVLWVISVAKSLQDMPDSGKGTGPLWIDTIHSSLIHVGGRFRPEGAVRDLINWSEKTGPNHTGNTGHSSAAGSLADCQATSCQELPTRLDTSVNLIVKSTVLSPTVPCILDRPVIIATSP